MDPRVLIIETSCAVGQVALARGATIVGQRRLEEARRHARDLVPAARDLLLAQEWNARQLDAVVVSRGPGSYTGLRVGIMTAKTLAYATSCALLAIDTFAVIARQAPAEAQHLAVLADAQQDKVYVQEFSRAVPGVNWQARIPLCIRKFDEWLAGLETTAWISGPGLQGKEKRLPDWRLVDPPSREPGVESLLHLGLERIARGERDDFWKVEPLYLRPSAAEEKWSERTSC